MPFPTTYAGAHRPSPTSRRALRTWVFVGLAAIVFTSAAFVIARYLGATFGVQSALLGLLVALLPTCVVVPTFLWLDRFESEPTRYLVLAFLWGALVATIIAAVFNTSAMAVLRSVTGDGSSGASSASSASALQMTAVLVAPVVEESAKGVLVLLVWWFLRREFDGLTDGMVYAGLTAAGFAFTENIQYLAHAYAEGGREMMTATFIGRGIMSPFAHPMFTVLIGVGVGVASMTRSRVLRVLAPVLGWVLAVGVHALWNLGAVTAGRGLLVLYLLLEVPVFVAFVVFAVWARRREGRVIGQFLRPYADAGWLSAAEVRMLASMARRREARRWARATGGKRALVAMREFQDEASELALLRRRMYNEAADERALTEERDLLRALALSRRAFVGGVA